MSARRLEVALVQHAMGTEADENRAVTADGIARAAGLGAELVLLPELHASEYFCKYQDPALFDLAEPLDGPTARMLSHAAADHGVVVVGSIFEHRAAGLAHNTAVVFERDGSRAGIYRKMHIPDDPGYNEKFYFTPGDLGFKVYPARSARVSARALLSRGSSWLFRAARESSSMRSRWGLLGGE